METPKDFNALVTWATWEVIQGITKGQPLRSIMYGVLQDALQIVATWKKS